MQSPNTVPPLKSHPSNHVLVCPYLVLLNILKYIVSHHSANNISSKDKKYELQLIYPMQLLVSPEITCVKKHKPTAWLKQF